MLPGPDHEPAGDSVPDWAKGVLESLYEVAFATIDREVAGVLVGQPAAGSDVPQIRAIIPAAEGYQIGQAAMFGHESWAHVHTAMSRHYAGLELVGWYISRPGNGTQMTDADMLNHQRWFARHDQVLLVLDSRSHRGALYAWSGDRLARISEGPVARRYTRPPRDSAPVAALILLTAFGILIGIAVFAAT